MKADKGFCFGSKAHTLARLERYPELGIPPLYAFDVAQWENDSSRIVEHILAFGLKQAARLVAVRSSCLGEDNDSGSGAGAFTSVLDICLEAQAITTAVKKVLDSYGTQKSLQDQVFVQPMLQDITVGGVIMTRVLTDGSPYFVINYDDESGKTDTITGGRGVSKTIYVYRKARSKDFDSQRVRRFVEFARRVEEICASSGLDMEFCLDSQDKMHLLQVRPICTQAQWIPQADSLVSKHLGFIRGFLCHRMEPWPGLYGQTTIFGVMPDWNPAEMIGVTPRLLASSMYRDLITRRIWSQARQQMGYKELPPEELMVLLAGRPYIDVRLSFNSFLPAGLDSVTGEALVVAWLDRLDNHPQFHDKVEFEVAQTCMDFCFDAHLTTRYPGLLTSVRKEDFRSCLCHLTQKAMLLDGQGSLQWAFEAVTELHNRQTARPLVSRQSLPANCRPLSQLLVLSEECRLYGTLPFSILARHAFMAESLLRSAVVRGALTQERVLALKSAMQTVAGQMSHDFLSVCQDSMGKDIFLSKYGHLRPSTYDILSPRYLDKPGLFSQAPQSRPGPCQIPPFVFTEKETHALELLLREAGLNQDVSLLEHYIRRVIPGREMAKFVFSRHVSDMLELIALWGEDLGLDREDLSFLDIRQIREWACHALLKEPKIHFQELARQGRELSDLGRSLKLAYLIRSPRDIFVVPQHRSAPNFVGTASVEAHVTALVADTDCSVPLEGRIVCIENADPGFDWIFTRNISGLVTMYGGTNSHMAIRCAEYGLPAAIGVGEQLFARITAASHCRLNPGACIVQEI